MKHTPYFFKVQFHTCNRYLKCPRKFCRAHVLKIQNSLQFLKTTVLQYRWKTICMSLVAAAEAKYYTNLYTHPPLYIPMYFFFSVFPISQPAKDLKGEIFQTFWELQTFQSFRQTTFHTTKQVCSLQGQNNDIFERATLLPCLSTGAAVLPAQ